MCYWLRSADVFVLDSFPCPSKAKAGSLGDFDLWSWLKHVRQACMHAWGSFRCSIFCVQKHITVNVEVPQALTTHSDAIGVV